MKTNSIRILIPVLAAMLLILVNCNKEEPIKVATLSTLSVTNISTNTAQSGGNITSDGGGDITSRGVVWCTQVKPSLENHSGITEDGSGEGIYTSTISGLSPETVYFVRAFARNSAGTSYGNDIMFETLPEEDEIIYGQAIDVEGNLYTTVFIGQQEWFAENLRVRHYSDGSIIPTISPDQSFSIWIEQIAGATTHFPYQYADGISNPTEMINAYGRLYNWYVAVDKRGLCPTGWRVPTDGDFTELRNFIILNYDEISNDNIGQALKSCRQVNSPLGGSCATDVHPRWNEYENYGTDQFGFSITPASERTLDPDLRPGMVGNGYIFIG